MTPQQAKQWIEQSPPTRKLLDDLGIPINPPLGSLDEMEVEIIAEGMKESYEAGCLAMRNVFHRPPPSP